ncbi:alpha/beta hydrolase [Nocardioides sp. HDW12B]|uniref:alpha/beta hydrolase n=1 Tax=Nocardioides sp. HDW12B TaxID=2714939 RepID=UPI001409267C|nr:alpha/beta hydrolase [Nocardioides sp. HDW12B]QIK65764.1 alpha/beta hydrolase [Nocardioides sp. HDW12B]
MATTQPQTLVRTGDPVDAQIPDAITPAHPEPGLVDALALGALFADELIVATARDTHEAFARRTFDLLTGTSPFGRVTRGIHDAVAGTVYRGLSLGLQGAATGLSKVGATGVGPRLDASPQGRVLQSAVNGLIGERLKEEHPHLALTMTIRVDGRAVRPDPAELEVAFPEATDKVVVFLHGLGEHEGHWNTRAAEMGGTYGSRLAESDGWTPVFLRVNTGLSVAENGVALTALLQELTESWPVRVGRIALVGHSMGGLIIRAGCAVTTEHERSWRDVLTDVVTLGTPHLGADLALGVSHGSRFLALLPEIAGFGRILEHRSSGIRDLERGLPDLPPMEGVRYRLVSAALGSERSPVGAVFGDLLVRRASATGLRRSLRLFPDADVLHVANAGHFALLNHPEVDDALVGWLA